MVREIKTLCVLNLPVSPICYLPRERICKVPEVTIPFSSSKVFSLNWHPVMDEMENPLLEWTDEHTKPSVSLF